jgi:hypothetical protein
MAAASGPQWPSAGTRELAAKERAATAEFTRAAHAARAEAADQGRPFDFNKWAYGMPADQRFPYGPPWEVRAGGQPFASRGPPALAHALCARPRVAQPMVHGVPTRWRATLGMNAFDWSNVGLAALLGYGVAVSLRACARRGPALAPRPPRARPAPPAPPAPSPAVSRVRLRYTNPVLVGVGVAMGTSVLALNSAQSRAALRLMGFVANGNPARLDHAAYVDDAVPYFVKHHEPTRGARAASLPHSSADAFRE